MTYLLDTCACIAFLRSPASPVRNKLADSNPQDVAVCAIVKAELYYGAYRSVHPQRTLETVREFLGHFRSIPFDDQAAEVYGQIRADLAGNGRLIGPNDLLIAAIVLAHQATLVTHNVAEFSRVSGLQIEDWQV
jgi:tRNA(fMet)-specific endonuclease VapC